MVWLSHLLFDPKLAPRDYAEYDDDSGNATDGSRSDGPNIKEEVHIMLEDKHDILEGLFFLVVYMAVGVVAYSFVFENWG